MAQIESAKPGLLHSGIRCLLRSQPLQYLARNSDAAAGLFLSSRPRFPAAVSASARTAAGFATSLIDGGRCQAATPTLLNFNHQEHTVNKDQTKGRVEEVKGKVKEIAGKLSGDKKLEDEGKLQNLKGRVQAGFGDLKEDIKKAV